MQRLTVEWSSIPEEGISRHFVTDKQGLGITDSEPCVVRPMEITCEFFRVDREVVVQGILRSAVRLTCGRCAEEFVLALGIPLDAVYLPAHGTPSEREKELEAATTDVYTYDGQVIDIAEMVRDKVLLSFPLQPLCTPGCAGLCPSCGANRNAVQCQCAEVKLGSPFELLKDLRSSQEG